MSEKPDAKPVYRHIGFWLAAIIGAMQALNAVRAFTDPLGFAGYMGLPISGAEHAGFVLVYGFRTAFIAGLVGLLLWLRRFDTLAWVALIAVIMPVGDAWLATQAGAPATTIFRHVGIAVYVLVAFFFLRRDSLRAL